MSATPATAIAGNPPEEKITRYAWTVLFCSFVGYAFDAMEMMLYSMVLLPITQEFGLTLVQGGLVMTISLLGYAVGSTFWGYYTDKIGRIRVLTWTVALYAIFTGTTSIAWNVPTLIISRFLTGFAAGGEWSAGAALVGENWPAKYRTRAMAVMQAGWPVGIICAAAASWAIAPHFGWRAVFLVGVLPAIVVFLIRRCLKESTAFQDLQDIRSKTAQKAQAELTEKEKEVHQNPILLIFTRKYIRWTALIVVAGSACLIAYWGCLTWLPTYFAQERGWSIAKSSAWMIIINSSAAISYLIYGAISDKIGRRISLTIFWVMVMGIMPVFVYTSDPTRLLFVAAILGFSFAFFPGFPTWAAELFPTHIRATGFGISYSTIARVVSTIAPYGIAVLAGTMGWQKALVTVPLVLIVAIIAVWTLGVETKGKALD